MNSAQVVVDTIDDTQYDVVVNGGLFFGKERPSIQTSNKCRGLFANNVFMRRPSKWYHVREWFSVFRYVVNLPHG